MAFKALVAALVFLSVPFARTPFLTASPCAEGSLWIADGDSKIYHIYPNGKLISSFTIGGGVVPNGIALDTYTGNLFVVAENTNRLYQFTRQGVSAASPVDSSTWDATVSPAPETESVTFDPRTSTLWIVDDSRRKLYNVQKNGTLINEYALDGTIAGSQGVVMDLRDFTLWVSDNEDNIIYHITTIGGLLTADNISLPEVTRNWQGIALEPYRRTFWLLTYDSGGGLPGYSYRVNLAAKSLITGSGLPVPHSTYGSGAQGSGAVFDYNCS